jgi:hypothetical protein
MKKREEERISEKEGLSNVEQQSGSGKIEKRLESFAPCCSQSRLLEDLKKPILFAGLKCPYKKIESLQE